MLKYIQRAAERLMILPRHPSHPLHPLPFGECGACVYFAYLTLHLSAKLS